MSTVRAYAASKANGDLEPFEYELGPIGPEEDIAVESSGICHSDLSMLENAWSVTRFPFVKWSTKTGHFFSSHSIKYMFNFHR